MWSNSRSRIFSVAIKRDQLILSAFLIGAASTASATDYSASASISADASHNDNIRLTATDKTAVYKYLLTPVFTLNADTENSTLQLASTLYFNRYDHSQFNSDDQNLGLAFTHNFESSSVGVNANIVRDSTITSEQLTSGVIGEKAVRTDRYQVSPNWAYTLNETSSLQMSGNLTKQDYKSDAYTGYKNAGAGLDWIYILSERLKLITSLTYSDYHSDESQKFDIPGARVPITVQTGIDPATGEPIIENIPVPIGALGQQSYSTRTKEAGGQLGVDYQWSEATLLQARLGRSRSKTSYPLTDPQDSCGNVFRQELIRSNPAYIPYFSGLCNLEPTNDLLSTAELDWKWSNENHQLGVTATKSSQPSSNGYVVDALQASSFWIFRLTELDQISANVAMVRNRSLGGDSQQQNNSLADRDYQSASISYQHQLDEHWSVNTSYQFNRQKYTNIDYQANSKTISLGIRYQPQAWHWSR